jgi:hypothetical protein
LALWTQNKAKFSKKLFMTWVVEKNDHFSDDNCRKSQKIVIITSAPDDSEFLVVETKQNLGVEKILVILAL